MDKGKIKSNITFILLLITLTIVLGVQFSCDQQHQEAKKSQEKQSGIVIRGEITNYEKLKPLFRSDSYLQLILVPPDGSIKISTDSIARYTFGPGYAKTSIDNDGKFIFQTNELDSGTYNIAAQLLEFHHGPFPFLVQGSDFVKIEIKDSMQIPVVFDIGKCAIKED